MKYFTYTGILAGLLLLSGCRLSSFNSLQSRNPTLNRTEGPIRSSLTELTSQGSRLIDRARSKPAPSSSLRSLTENLNRAHVEAAQGRFEQAKMFYRRVLQEQSDHAVAHHRLAIIADKEQDFQNAERHYLAALREKPGDPDLFSDLGYSYLLQQRYQESENTLNRVLEIQPTHPRALNNLGLLYGTAGQFDKAIDMFRLAGSERDAQEKMAMLFPQGRPVTSGPPLPSQRGPQQIAANQQGSRPRPAVSPSGAMNSWPAGSASFATDNVPEDPNNIHQHLRDMVEGERNQSRTRRNQEIITPQQLPLDAHVPLPQGGPTSIPGQPHASLESVTPSRPVNILPGELSRLWGHPGRSHVPRISDGQINQAFAGIDQSNGTISRRPAATAGDLEIREPRQSLPAGASFRPSGLQNSPFGRAKQSRAATTSGTDPTQLWPAGKSSATLNGPSTSIPPNEFGSQPKPWQSSGIAQANHSQEYRSSSGNRRSAQLGSTRLDGAQRAAAILGMNAGPGVMLPMMNGPSSSAPSIRSAIPPSSQVSTNSDFEPSAGEPHQPERQALYQRMRQGRNPYQTAANALDEYQRQNRESQEPFNTASRPLQSERQFPPSAGMPRQTPGAYQTAQPSQNLRRIHSFPNSAQPAGVQRSVQPPLNPRQIQPSPWPPQTGQGIPLRQYNPPRFPPSQYDSRGIDIRPR